MSSPRRRPAWPAWPARDCPTPRSPPARTSARASSTTTWTRWSASSGGGWTMSSASSALAACRRVRWRGVSAEEGLDHGNEGCLVLEQEGVAGVGVEGESGAGDQAGEDVVVGERDELVLRAVGDERGGGDLGGLRAGRVAPGPPLVDCV